MVYSGSRQQKSAVHYIIEAPWPGPLKHFRLTLRWWNKQTRDARRESKNTQTGNIVGGRKAHQKTRLIYSKKPNCSVSQQRLTTITINDRRCSKLDASLKKTHKTCNHFPFRFSPANQSLKGLMTVYYAEIEPRGNSSFRVFLSWDDTPGMEQMQPDWLDHRNVSR